MFVNGTVAKNIGAGVVINVYQQVSAKAGSTWLVLKFVADGFVSGNDDDGKICVRTTHPNKKFGLS